MNLKISRTVSPVTATQKVCLWRSATPNSISPKIINSTLTGPTDGTLPVDAEAISGTINKRIKRKVIFEILLPECKKLFII
jgi:hypothetical protein